MTKRVSDNTVSSKTAFRTKSNVIICYIFFFFFNDTATTEIYTLSLHDALPISCATRPGRPAAPAYSRLTHASARTSRSEEHTSELQSRSDLVCRLLLEKKKKSRNSTLHTISQLATFAASSITHAHISSNLICRD